MSQSLYQIQMESTEIAGAPTAQKRKAKNAEKETIEHKEAVDKQLSFVEITDSMRVNIHFSKLITKPLTDGDSENETLDIVHKVSSKIRPHKDLVNAMKRLRKIALEICEMPEPESKELQDYTVSAVKIHGDMFLRKSRATLTIAKKVKRTGKIVKIVTPQTVMYGQSDYHQADTMAQMIEEVVKEAWAYIETGKCDEGDQLPLFER